MPTSALNFVAILVLVLPGFLSYRSALSRSADPSPRSVLWQLSAMVEYSVYIHLLGAILVFGVAALLDSVFGLETHLSELPAKRPHEFLSDYFVEGSLLFILYPLYVIVFAVVMGDYEVPSRVATEITKGSGLLARWVVRVPGLRRTKPPRPNFPQEPIWYHAFHVATGGFVEARLSVLVRMKTGDIYYGEIEAYPILPDSQREKDFLIRRAVYTPVGSPGKQFRLEDQPGGGTVLLNSADVDSIQIYYAPTEGNSDLSV